MWEYILATRHNRKHVPFESEYCSVPELVDQYNLANKTKFIGIPEGWLKHPEFGQCHIKTLDGMCGVMIAHKLNIPNYVVNEWMPLLEWMAKKGNYTYITMSNIVGDRLRAWKAQGFTTMLAFTNKRTGNNVELLIKKVPYETT